ncbi:MAG: PilZ domain-containing protein [Candidatus Omnitrophica bacterium]|nr:PilZ domain-containing protein [Candidatus Omnitrophota bacterium]
MQERRKLIRCQVNQRGGLKLKQAAEELFCQVKDINCKGVKIILSAKLPEDTTFRINLRLSEKCIFEAEVWVAWRKVVDGINHHGLYFIKIGDADKNKIDKFINTFYPNSLKQKWLGPVAAEKEKGGEDVNDHRVFERFRKEVSARFIGLDGKEGVARTFDVSAKGLGLSTNHELESRANLEIWLDVPNSTDPLYTRGQVVWSRLAGTGGFCSGIELERADLMGVSRLLRA